MADRDRKSSLPSKRQDSGPLPAGYAPFLEDLKARIRAAQVKAALSVNRELIDLYWHIGMSIVEHQRAEGWGKAVVESLSADLQREFPGIAGFSPQNIWYMRAFYLTWTDEVRILQQAVGDSVDPILQQAVREMDACNPPQAIREIPWGHNIQLITKIKNPLQRLWYALQAIANGWSRAVLVHQIESDLYGRQGKALTNFQATLPAPQSDLAQQLVKDPYSFEFLGIGADISERHLERTLTDRLKDFLVELGKGFAFVGQQYRLDVEGDDYYLDLLFYHLHLRCYVVIDLKVVPFKPEFAGKMNFYLSAVDDQLRHREDQPSIGLILCKERNRLVVEYTLRDTTKPMGVATYRVLPRELKKELPTAKQIMEGIEKK
jgi:predicted nuclease of restriction endonuclease-like (RecB) superfamily